ncbi:sodium:solute symporter [Clostridium sp. Mt-5]|uniref:Sodium:solute symporter n=1 Tax=Clostridium moutaii TaxID=3240932 RepID=A0ABV4BML5_9CLOT
MNITLTALDNVVIVAFMILAVWIGYHFSKAAKDMETFYLGNHSLPWSLTVGTLFSTWYGGVGTVGTIEYASVYGLSCWLIWSVTSHMGRIPLAVWVGPKIHVRTAITVPDLLHSVYGKGVALLGAFFMFLYCIRLGEVTAAGFIGQSAWGIKPELAGFLAVMFVVLITVLGGLMGVAVMDMIHFWIMLVVICMIMPINWHSIGGWAGITHGLSSTPKLMDPYGGFTFMKGLMLVLLAFGVYADPAFYQRFSAANSPKAGRRALLTCLIIWVAFDVVLVMTGLIVKILYPNIPPAEGYIQLVFHTLPVGLRGLFIVAIFGAIISALCGYYLTGGATLANDFYARIKGNVSQKKIVFLTRCGVIVVAGLGLLIAFKFTTAQDAMIFTSSIWMSAGFVPIVGALLYKGKITTLGGYMGMITGIIVFILVKLFPPAGISMEPLVAALPLSAIAWFIGNKIGKERISGKLTENNMVGRD